jgi:hypothetical protein
MFYDPLHSILNVFAVNEHKLTCLSRKYWPTVEGMPTAALVTPEGISTAVGALALVGA